MSDLTYLDLGGTGATYSELGTPFGAAVAPTVTFGGIEGNSGNLDDDGNEWTVSAVDGWDSPVVRMPTVDRPFADGAFISDGYYGPRPLTVKGACFAATGRAGVLAAERRLPAALNLMRTTGLIVVDDKQAAVRRGPALRMFQEQDHLLFEADLIAPDPRKYAALASTVDVDLPTASGGLVFPIVDPISFGPSGAGGTADAVNEGTIDTWPTVTFTGPVTSPGIELVDTGETVTVDLTLNPAETLTVDMLARTIILAGSASRRGSLRPGSTWFPLRPGTNTVRFTAAALDPTAQLTVSWRSAWL